MECTQYCARPAKTADCGFSQPCATQDHEWKKADAGSFVGDIDLLVIIIDANSNKNTTNEARSYIKLNQRSLTLHETKPTKLDAAA